MIFSQEIQVRDFIKDGVVRGLEVDFDLPFPDGFPPKRIRKKSPFVPGLKLTREKAVKQSFAWGEVLRQKLWANGNRPPSREELRAEAAKPKPEPIPTLDKFAARWVSGALEANQISAKTIEIAERDLRLHLLSRFGSKLLDSFGIEDYQRLKSELKLQPNGKQRSAVHLNKVLKLLVRILRDAYEWGVISKYPPKPSYLKEPRSEVEIYNESQYQRLLQVSKEQGWQLYLLVLLAGDAGLRAGELLGLQWSDIDWRNGRLTVNRQDTREGTKKPKSQKSRVIPMSPQLLSALHAHRHLGVRVLVRNDGKPVNRYNLRDWLQRAEEIAELPLKTIHKLRHTFATRYLQHRGNLRDCQELLGHSNLTTTQIYLHADPKEAQRIIQTLGSGEN